MLYLAYFIVYSFACLYQYLLNNIIGVMKTEGQEAVSRIIEIREFFPKTNSITAKEDYVQDFKKSLLNLVAYLKN